MAVGILVHHVHIEERALAAFPREAQAQNVVGTPAKYSVSRVLRRDVRAPEQNMQDTIYNLDFFKLASGSIRGWWGGRSWG